MAAENLTRVLDEAGVGYDLLPHVHTISAAAEAEALGLAPRDVAKTLIVKTGDGYVRVVLQGSGRLDLRKLRALLDGNKHDVRLASEEDLGRDFPEFELGAVPPIGGGRRDPVVVDSRVAEREALVLEAGSHEESVRLATDDLIRLAHAQVADVSES
jgi:prolyl-tRNA editing enzyme YbaK/EbsC (Cys-tRNA(Pro) deacylase)